MGMMGILPIKKMCGLKLLRFSFVQVDCRLWNCKLQLGWILVQFLIHWNCSVLRNFNFAIDCTPCLICRQSYPQNAFLAVEMLWIDVEC